MRILLYTFVIIFCGSIPLKAQKATSKNQLLTVLKVRQLAQEGLQKQDYRPLLKAVKILAKNPRLRPLNSSASDHQINTNLYRISYLLDRAEKFAPSDNAGIQRRIQRYRDRNQQPHFQKMAAEEDGIRLFDITVEAQKVLDFPYKLNHPRTVSITSSVHAKTRIQILLGQKLLTEDQSNELCRIEFETITTDDYTIRINNLTNKTVTNTIILNVRKQ